MSVAIDTIIALFLLIVMWQDFKQRQISWWTLPVLFLLFTYKGIFDVGVGYWGESLLINLSFVVLQLLILTAYMSLRNGKLLWILDTYLGWGDALFFVVICAAFSPVNFMLFYTISLLLSLLAYLIYNKLAKNVGEQIPLAGLIAGLLILLIGADRLFFNAGFYSEALVATLFER